MADGVINKPFVAYVERRVHAFDSLRGSSCTRLLLAYVYRLLEAFGGIRGLSFPSLWWLRWIAVHKPLVAEGLVYQPLVACVDRRLQAFGGKWSYYQAVGGIRGSSFTSLWWQMESFTSLWWHTWIVVYKAFDGVNGSSCRSLWWYTWVVDCKPLVAHVDRRSQAFGGR